MPKSGGIHRAAPQRRIVLHSLSTGRPTDRRQRWAERSRALEAAAGLLPVAVAEPHWHLEHLMELKPQASFRLVLLEWTCWLLGPPSGFDLFLLDRSWRQQRCLIGSQDKAFRTQRGKILRFSEQPEEKPVSLRDREELQEKKGSE